jgi:hypothetical protein
MKTRLPAWFVLFAGIVPLLADPSGATPRSVGVGHRSTTPNVVLVWNAAISDHFEEGAIDNSAHIQARVYAMTHLAIRDAIAAAMLDARGKGADMAARSAAVASAHAVLAALRPAGAARFAALRAEQFATIPDAETRARGILIGERTATEILSRRAKDEWPFSVIRTEAEEARAALASKAPIPKPFVLRRAQQIEPEPPYFVYSDGIVLPNTKLRNRKYIGDASEAMLAAENAGYWRSDPVLTWNRVAQAMALDQPTSLERQARLFAVLNVGLADALLSAVYWSRTYTEGHAQRPIEAIGPEVVVPPRREEPHHPAGLWLVATPMAGYPAIRAALAGAAESVLRNNFRADAPFLFPTGRAQGVDSSRQTTLRQAARECAWVALAAGTSTAEGCVAGYELGTRVGAHVLKHELR